MYSLVNSRFSRTYNPSGRQNALSDIKRLLTSRDTEAQNKACGYITEVISRYIRNSIERGRMVEYLLDNDITVFLCEATSNLDFSLFRSVLSCFRLLWREPRFFFEEHAAHASTAVLRALAQYACTDSNTAVDACLHFLCDLLNGISTHKAIPPLSHQSAYSAEQLLACMTTLAPRINTHHNSILSSALVLQALVSYQPDNLAIRGSTGTCLVEVFDKWLVLLVDTLNHALLVGGEGFGMFYVVVCQLGMDVLRLVKFLRIVNKAGLVLSILADDQEESVLRQSAFQLRNSVRAVISDLVVVTKENQNQIATEEYGVFLKFLLCFFYENIKSEQLTDFCDMMFAKGYLVMLPKVQIIRNDTNIRKVSTLVLGEMLKVLADKYLNIDEEENYDPVIHTGLVELQHGIEKPEIIGSQLQKSQPYSLLIYIYFYCQSSENPEEATAPLLPYLVEYLLRLPRSLKLPPYIIKALWLVFAMSAISNGSLESLDERVYLEKATNRLANMLHPEPSIYYTHNPAILLWAFTSQRISNYLRLQVLSQWLKTEDCLPTDLSTEPKVWEMLLNVLVQSKDKDIVMNCVGALHLCLEDGDQDSSEDFATLIWLKLPEVLAKVVVEESELEDNISHLLDLATTLIPEELDQAICLKSALLLTIVFSKNVPDYSKEESKSQYEYACLKLCLYLLTLSFRQNDSRVLLTYINRPGFLPSVLASTNSADDQVACAALQLLSYVVHYFSKNKYQPKSLLQMQTHLVIKSFRRDSSNERGASLLQLVYMVLNSGVHTPLVLSYDIQNNQPSMIYQYNALRALMFRIQLLLCCRDSETQSSAGWKTLSCVLKHAIIFKNDSMLVVTLTSQPWTHILIQFQIKQKVSQEFLDFTQNWLTLLKITIKKSLEEKKITLCKQSLVIKTLLLLKKNIPIDEEMKELKQKTLLGVKEILDDNGIRFI